MCLPVRSYLLCQCTVWEGKSNQETGIHATKSYRQKSALQKQRNKKEKCQDDQHQNAALTPRARKKEKGVTLIPATWPDFGRGGPVVRVKADTQTLLRMLPTRVARTVFLACPVLLSLMFCQLYSIVREQRSPRNVTQSSVEEGCWTRNTNAHLESCCHHPQETPKPTPIKQSNLENCFLFKFIITISVLAPPSQLSRLSSCIETLELEPSLSLPALQDWPVR